MTLQRFWRLTFVLVWLGIVIALTVLPGRNSVIYELRRTFIQADGQDVVGHLLLFASLVVVVYMGLSAWMPRRWALLIAVIVSFSLGTGTEWYQHLVRGRSATIDDLMANWAGTFGAAYAITLLGFRRRNTPHDPHDESL